ncbi:MAG TPA: phospholipid carrier-dependent glycosyltransferase [Thermoanaerobaculia bacterium]
MGVVARIAAALFAIGYFALLVANSCNFAAGPDSSGYLNEARLLATGRTHATVAPLTDGTLDPALIYLFTPYGFMRGDAPGTMVPTYPVGTSLHLLLGAALGGWRAGAFLIVPLMATASLFLMAFMARRFGASRGWAAVAALLLAAFPIFISQGVQPVSDVLATFWTLAAIACALRSDERWWWAAAAGVAFAVGVAVRPANVLVLLPLVIALRFRGGRLAAAGAAALPFALALMWYAETLYGSPFTTGYGGVGSLMSWRGVPPCLVRQATWLMTIGTPLLFPGGLFAAFDRRLGGRERALLVSWFAVFFVFYSYYSYCPDHASLRFLLPALPPLILGFVHLASRVTALRFGRAVAVMLVLVVLGREVTRIGRLHVLQLDDWESIFPDTVALVERQAPRDALVLSGIMSGAFYFHSERLVVRWDQLTPETTAVLRARFPGPWYAAVSEVEGGAEALRARVPGVWVEAGRVRDVTVWRMDQGTIGRMGRIGPIGQMGPMHHAPGEEWLSRRTAKRRFFREATRMVPFVLYVL